MPSCETWLSLPSQTDRAACTYVCAMYVVNIFRVLLSPSQPQNIFLDEHGNVKIGDFGLGRILGPLVRSWRVRFSCWLSAACS